MRYLETIFDLLLFPFLFIAKRFTLQKVNFKRLPPTSKRWMTSVAMLAFLFVSPMQLHAVDIWDEDFTGQNGKGAIGSSTDTTGVTWTIDVSGTTLSNNNDWFSVQNEAFDGRDLDGYAIWNSPSIDISAYQNVSFSLDSSKSGGTMESTDYVDIYYSIDGGAFTRIPNWNSSGDGSHTLIDDFSPQNISQSIGTATSLQIRVIMRNNGGRERYNFDNVLVTGNVITDTVEIAKTVNDTAPDVGETVSFTITTTNKGSSKRIEFRDGFPNSAADPVGWNTTYDAFENIAVSNVPSGVSCSIITDTNAEYVECITNSDYTHNQSFTVTVTADVKSAGHICNTAHAYENSWIWKSSSQVCMDAVVPDNADLKVIENGTPTPNPANIGEDVTFNVRSQNRGPNTAENDIIVKVSYNQDVTITSVTITAGDFSCDTTSGALSSGAFITCTKTSDWTSITNNKDFTFIVQPTASGLLTQTVTIESTETVDLNTSNNTLQSNVTVNGNSCINSATPFTTLAEASATTTAGLYCFDFSGTTFITYVDAGGYTLATIDFGDGSGNLVGTDELDDIDRGILLPAILSKLSDATEVRISSSDEQIDVTTTRTEIISRVTGSQTIKRGQSDNAINKDWVGTNAARITTDATCDKSADGLNSRIIHQCGYGDGFHWIPHDGTQRINWGSGEVAASVSFRLWVKVGTLPIIENADDLCFVAPIHVGCTTGTGNYLGGVGCKQTTAIYNTLDEGLTDVKVGIGIAGINSTMYTDCGIDAVSGNCADNNWTGLPDDTHSEGISFFPMPDFAVDANHSVYTDSNQTDPLFQGNNLYGTYSKGTDIYRGQIEQCKFSYCKSNNLSEGFHIIDPDGGDDSNSYEIYCANSTRWGQDLIALPIKNDYNNFVFENDSPATNYYDAADASKTADVNNNFSYLEIYIHDDHSISVVPESIAAGSTNNEGYFSNINLIGTPFYINWDDTVVTHCDVGKLRKGADDQAVKINTLDYSNGRCKVESMKLALLSDYKYLKWSDLNDGNEVLEETCRQIFETVPDAEGYLPNEASDGHYWIDPDQGGRGTDDGIADVFRPIVATCQYQADIGEAWTFVMALDGKVTNSKNDIKTMAQVRADPSIYHDTCSQLGLLFYVPNTKDTFERVRRYLYDKKPDWNNYTGTIREKYKMYTNTPSKEYYKAGEGYNEIWPYGPFGLYFPEGGIQSGPTNWYGGDSTKTAYMSGRCMNSGSTSGAATCTDYTPNSIYTAIPNDDNTMGIAGWRTTLEDMVTTGGLTGIHNGDQFWIADVGAGSHIHNASANQGTPECSITSPSSNSATSGACDEDYYEPNGNYTQYAWLNFIADSNGNVYHNDDNNAFYSYYDYMCMAWDNYHGVTRIEAIAGPFTVIDRNSSNPPYEGRLANTMNLSISTKITNRDMDLQLVTFDKNYEEADAVVSKDQNISAGVYLTYITKSGNSDIYHEQYYLGDIGGDSSPTLTMNTDGYRDLSAADLGGSKKITTAKRKMQFRFKYCQFSRDDWTQCWGSNNTCKAGCNPENITCNCQYASSDFFAVRPKEFTIEGITEDTKLLRSGIFYNFNSIKAMDDLNNTTVAYDQFGQFIEQNSTIYLNTDIADSSGKLNGVVDLNKSSDFDFENGLSEGDMNVSFDDVARINIELYDNEWASVDSSDSPDICNNDTPPYGRRICSRDTFMTFIPDHFSIVDLNLSNHDQRLTYLTYEDDLNMSAPLSVVIQAKNADDNITQNFRYGSEYYENTVELNITVPTMDANNTNINLISVKHDIPNPLILGFGGVDANGTHKIPFAESTASHRLMFNYNKLLNVTKNPFKISGSDVVLTARSTYVGNSENATIAGTNSGTGLATLYYAKIKSSEFFYDYVTTSSKTVPITLSIYCDLNVTCGMFGIDTTATGSTSEDDWYLSLNHRQDRGDGDIVLKVQAAPLIEGAGSPTIDTMTNPNGASIIILDPDNGSKDTNVTSGVSPSLPMTVGIEIVQNGDTFTPTPPFTHGWLLHNKDDPVLLPSPFFKVRFIGEDADWTGVGKTGHAMDINTSATSTKRMDW